MTLKTQKFRGKKIWYFFAEKFWENILTYFQKISAKIFSWFYNLFIYLFFLCGLSYILTCNKHNFLAQNACDLCMAGWVTVSAQPFNKTDLIEFVNKDAFH